MSQQPKQDSGLIKRGLCLLAAIGVLVAVVLWIIFQRPVQTLPPETKQPEPLVASLVASPLTPAVDWAALALLTDKLPSNPGWDTRYNAVASLARLGSDKVPWGALAEMLDEDQQMRNFRIRLASGKIVPDEAAARLTMINALKAIKQWHEKQPLGKMSPSAEQTRVYAVVDQLAQSPVVELKKQAEETREAIRKKNA
jgi:hypothetical protein